MNCIGELNLTNYQNFKGNVRALFVSLFFCLSFLQANAQEFDKTPPDSSNQGVKSVHPNEIPYESQKSVTGHLLSFPSYLFHWATRPIGWSIKLAELELPKLFQGERGSYGVYPLFELGGDVGAAYGLLLYHNAFLPYNHRVRLEALFGSEEYNDFDFTYTIPGLNARGSSLEFDGSYSNDPVKSLFGGNSSTLADERLYSTEELEADIEFRQAISSSTHVRWTAGYRMMDIQLNERITNDPLPLVSEPLRGTTSLVSLGSSIHFDFVEGTPRTNRGSRYILGLDWQHSLTNDQFHYLAYHLEWQQFLPLGFLPDSRRLAFKSRLQKAAPLGDKEIPFFDIPSLGSSRDLRGFPSDRFQDDGSLLLTLEYRYPVWNFADVVLFVDEGQVFSRYTDIAFKDFHTSYGFGFHLISTKGFAFRSEFAFSRESSRVILSINPNF